MMRIRSTPLPRAIAVLERYVALCERRYGLTTDQAAAACMAGTLHESAEVARWLMEHRALLRLRTLGRQS